MGRKIKPKKYLSAALPARLRKIETATKNRSAIEFLEIISNLAGVNNHHF